jgi:signal peptide peptidase SppA
MANKRKPALSTLAALFAGQPVLVSEESKSQFEALIASASEHEDWPRIEAAMSNVPMAAASDDDDYWNYKDEWDERLKPYQVSPDGVLFVPVRGVLLNSFPYAWGNYATGYHYIQKAIERGMDDPNVRGIALLCNSPGGMVAGCFEAVDKVYARRGEKPIRAFAHESAYSAAYAIASVADSIVVSKTGGVGSIGVVTMHVDWSKWNEEMGLKYTFIFAGKHKVDGNPEEPLSDDAKKRIQARIDELYDVFVSSVARNRGMEEKVVRDTEALTYTATQAVSIGLADSIGPLDDAVAQFCVDLSTPNSGEQAMSIQKDNTAVVEQAVHEQAVSAAKAEGIAEGAAAATARIGAILGSDEAKGREELANHFAFKTSMSAEDAVAALAVSPKAEAPASKETAETPGSGFDAAMSQDAPNLSADGSDADASDENSPEAILALAQQFGIAKKAK